MQGSDLPSWVPTPESGVIKDSVTVHNRILWIVTPVGVQALACVRSLKAVLQRTHDLPEKAASGGAKERWRLYLCLSNRHNARRFLDEKHLSSSSAASDLSQVAGSGTTSGSLGVCFPRLSNATSGLDHKSATRNPTRKRGYVVTRSSLTLRATGLSLLATARVLIKAAAGVLSLGQAPQLNSGMLPQRRPVCTDSCGLF